MLKVAARSTCLESVTKVAWVDANMLRNERQVFGHALQLPNMVIYKAILQSEDPVLRHPMPIGYVVSPYGPSSHAKRKPRSPLSVATRRGR